MFYIDSNDDHIYISKGDSATLEITIMKDDEEYTMQEGEEIIFSVKAALDYNYTLFSRTNTEPQIEFFAADTNSLSCCEFDYSIALEKSNGDRDTFLTGKFTVLGVCEDAKS